MRSRFFGTLCAAFLVCLVQTHVAFGAVVFDFAAMAVGNEGPFTTATIGGIKVVGSALPAPNAKPYLDDVSGGNPAGLGVCRNFSGSMCTPSSEDNVTAGETLTLAFFNAATDNPLSVILDPTFFRNAQHGTNFPADALISIQLDGMGFVDYALANIFGTSLTGSVFDFKYKNAEFYLQTATVSPVPLPAALPLFLAALGGLGFFGWRRKRMAVAAA